MSGFGAGWWGRGSVGRQADFFAALAVAPMEQVSLQGMTPLAVPNAVRAPAVNLPEAAENGIHGLEASDRELAPPEPGGASSAALAAHSSQRGAEHGVRRRASVAVHAGGGTRTPSHAARDSWAAYRILSTAASALPPSEPAVASGLADRATMGSTCRLARCIVSAACAWTRGSRRRSAMRFAVSRSGRGRQVTAVRRCNPWFDPENRDFGPSAGTNTVVSMRESTPSQPWREIDEAHP